MFNFKALIFAALVAFHSLAAPAAASDAEELVVLATKDTPFGTLTYYGDVPGANSTTATLAARACGSNDVKCDDAHVPPANICDDLINSINSAPNRNRVLPNSPRSICLSNGGTCCVSWKNVAPGMPEGDLYSAALKTYNTCVVAGLSGVTDNTDLNGVCTRQCLSNRATGC